MTGASLTKNRRVDFARFFFKVLRLTVNHQREACKIDAKVFGVHRP